MLGAVSAAEPAALGPHGSRPDRHTLPVCRSPSSIDLKRSGIGQSLSALIYGTAWRCRHLVWLSLLMLISVDAEQSRCGV